MASGGRDLQDIPLTDIITKQPRNGPENQNNPANSNGDETAQLTGLGPMRDGLVFKIKQKIRLKDICGEVCGCEAEKKYAIQGVEGDTLYWAKERSDFCSRCCLPEVRPLNIRIEDQTGAPVLSLRRPLNCSGCCCACCYPHCTQKMEVSLADGKVIGWVRERATWCFPVYHVFTPDNQQAFKVRGPFCHFQLCWCADVQFDILRAESGVKVGVITKKWLGWCREAAIDADHFVVELEEGAEMAVEEKALVLATAFLMDLMFYENDSF